MAEIIPCRDKLLILLTRISGWFFLVMLLIVSAASRASNINEINSYQIDLDSFSVGYLHDKNNTLTLNDVTTASFESIKNQYSLGLVSDVVWYKVSFINRTPTAQTLYLHDKLAFMSRQIDVIEFSGKQMVDQNRYDLFSREGDYKLSGSTLVYSFTLIPDVETTIYIKKQVPVFQVLDLQVYDKYESQQALMNKNIYSNMIVVILFTLAFYNFIFFFFSARKEFIFYSMYLFNAALGLFYMYGSVFQHTHLYGVLAFWFNLTAILVSFFMALFIKAVFDINKKEKLIYWLLNSVVIFSLLDLIVALFINLPIAIKVLPVIFTYSFFVIAYVIFYFYKKHHPLAIIFSVAYGFYILSFSITLLMLSGFIDYCDLAFHASGIGLVMEALLLSYMINYRIKILEQELAQHKNIIMLNNKKAQMGDMITAIIHQWKQPLTAIGSITTLLAFRLTDKEKIPTSELKLKCNQINNKVQFLSETINDFRYFFEPEKNYIEQDVDDIVNQVIALLHEDMLADGIIVKTELNFSKKMCINKNELLHILLNLMQNSKEAFEGMDRASKMIKIIGFIKNNRLIIDIIDNAGGIEKNKLPYIFDEYYTTKEKQAGSGLGLYLSKFIIENHMNGTIEAINFEDGIMFRITI